MKYEKISDKSEKYIFTVIMLSFFIILIFLFFINYILKFYINQKFCYIIYSIILLCVMITMILVAILPKIINSNFSYYIDNEKIEVKAGIINLSQKIVLLENVYKVIIKKKIIGRIFGISSFTLVTSAGNAKIYFLDNSQVEELYKKVILRIEE